MKDRLGGNDSSSKQALQCVKTCQNVFYHFNAISANCSSFTVKRGEDKLMGSYK